jgi:outer membrane protein assembly factor BamB
MKKPANQHLVFGGMWLLALLAVGGIYVTQESGRSVHVTRPTDDAPVFDVEDVEPLAGTRGASAQQQPIPDGAPAQHRGDRRHTGRSPYAGPARPGVFWSYESEHHVVGQAVVDDEGNTYFGSRDDHVYSISRTGGRRWERDLGGDVYSTPALDGEGHLFVGSDSDFFFCLDAETGEIVWNLRADDDVDTGVAIGPDGTLYFGAGQELWAVAPDGTTRWRFRVRVKIFSTPAVEDDGTIYVGAQDDRLYAISPEGELRWFFQTPDDIDSSPVIGDDGTIYFGSDDRRVYAVDRDGHELWRSDVGGYVRAPVALGSRGDLIVPVFGPNARISSLDRATGAVRWDFAISLEATDAGVGAGPVVDRDGNVYFGGDDDFVYSIDADGGLRWIFETEGNVDGDPTITPDGTLLVGSDDGHMYALRSDPVPPVPATATPPAPTTPEPEPVPTTPTPEPAPTEPPAAPEPPLPEAVES